jgi:hypothetical protein
LGGVTLRPSVDASRWRRSVETTGFVLFEAPAGRTDTLSAFERHLQSARRVPKHFVITGLRGTGKTVLLREFQRLLNDHGWLWAARELDESANDTQVLMQAVSTDLLKIGTSASLALRLRETGRRVVDTLKPRDIRGLGGSV